MKTIKIIIMCGLPCSGKSTWASNNKSNKVVVSADELRKLIYNQDFWAEGETLVWHIRSIFLKSLLQQGADIIIDETNTTVERRKSIIKLAKKYGYTVICNVMQTPIDICTNRAAATNPDLIPVINKMHTKFEEVTKEEGIDEIIYITKE